MCSGQRSQWNDTIDTTINRSIDRTSATDGLVTADFLRAFDEHGPSRLKEKNDQMNESGQMADETYIVGNIANVSIFENEKEAEANPLYIYQYQVNMHAVNKLSARVRRRNPHLHQGTELHHPITHRVTNRK